MQEFKCYNCSTECNSGDYSCLSCGEIFWESEDSYIKECKKLHPKMTDDEIKNRMFIDSDALKVNQKKKEESLLIEKPRAANFLVILGVMAVIGFFSNALLKLNLTLIFKSPELSPMSSFGNTLLAGVFASLFLGILWFFIILGLNKGKKWVLYAQIFLSSIFLLGFLYNILFLGTDFAFMMGREIVEWPFYTAVFFLSLSCLKSPFFK